MSSEAQRLHASFPSAGFTRRLAAWVYDLLVAAAIIMLASALALLFAALLTSFNWLVLSDDMDHAAWLAQGPWYSLYLITVVAVFFGWFWKRSGQTLGMRAWRLKLQNRDGSRLTNRQVFIRLLTLKTEEPGRITPQQQRLSPFRKKRISFFTGTNFKCGRPVVRPCAHA